MKRLILALAAMSISTAAAAVTTPPPLNGKAVVDSADILTPIQEDSVNDKLLQIQKSTNHQVAVLTLPTLNGEDAADFGLNAFRYYKLGSKERNDGVLLLVSMSNPRRLQISVGYGLEGELTDAESRRITETMKPFMKGGEYAEAILTGLDGIESEITKEVVTPQQVAASNERRKTENAPDLTWLILGIIILFGGGIGSILYINAKARREEEEAEKRRRIREAAREVPWDVAVERAKKFNEAFAPKAPAPKVTPIPAPKVKHSPEDLAKAREIVENDRRREQEAEARRRREREEDERRQRDSYSSSSWSSSSSSDSSSSWSSSSSSYDSGSSFSGDGGSSGGGGGGSDW